MRKLLADLVDKKPEKFKGAYFQKVLIKSTFGSRCSRGKYWRLHLPFVDPRSPTARWGLQTDGAN